MTETSGARRFLGEQSAAVRVLVAEARGSTPREAGAWMLVSPGSSYRTIGGGRLELIAIERARQMIRNGIRSDRLEVPLGPEIGQCCGGRVVLQLDLVDAALAAGCVQTEEEEAARRPHVFLFGAGHVGRALAAALALLPVRVLVADSREEALAGIRPPAEPVLAAVPETLIREAPAGSGFVILTHDHALDFVLAAEALARDDAAYAGMIGSRTKRQTFRSWFLRNGGDEARLGRLVMPIGGDTADKRPQIIAALAAAEIVRAILAHASTG